MKSSHISKVLSVQPEMWHDVGTERVTKNGRKLGGTYEESLVSIDLCKGKKINAEDILFEEFIANQNKEFSKHSDFFTKVCETGGTLEYFVGWFSEGSINMNIFLDASLMKATSELGVSIVLCAYPEDE